MEKYLTAVSIEPEADKIHAYCVDSVDHFNWLEGLGFTFERSFYPEKAVIQPGTEAQAEFEAADAREEGQDVHIRLPSSDVPQWRQCR